MFDQTLGIVELGLHDVTAYFILKKLSDYGRRGVRAVGRTKGIHHPHITQLG